MSRKGSEVFIVILFIVGLGLMLRAEKKSVLKSGGLDIQFVKIKKATVYNSRYRGEEEVVDIQRWILYTILMINKSLLLNLLLLGEAGF